MARNCSSMNFVSDRGLVHYVTHVVMAPELFSLALIGSLAVVATTNHVSLRADRSLWVYVCGLAAVHACAILSTLPRSLIDLEILNAEMAHTQFMAYVTAATDVFKIAAQHAGLWLLACLGLHGYSTMKRRHSSSRWERNSACRILVFAIVLCCTLVNSPRYLELSIVHKSKMNNCFPFDVWQVKKVDVHGFFSLIYECVTAILLYILPMLLIMISAIMIGMIIRKDHPKKVKVALRTPKDVTQTELQLKVTLWYVLIVGNVLHVPALTVSIWKATNKFIDPVGSKNHIFFTNSSYIAEAVIYVFYSALFVVFSICCSDFRKALRRTFCCLCNTADEYYEPLCACAYPRFKKREKRHKDTSESTESPCTDIKGCSLSSSDDSSIYTDIKQISFNSDIATVRISPTEEHPWV